MKSDQIDILAAAVFRNLEQVDQTVEAGLTRELRGDIRKPNGLNGIDFNLAFVHRITAAHPDARTHPDANAAGDVAAPHAVAKTFREDHRGILQRLRQRGIAPSHRRNLSPGANIMGHNSACAPRTGSSLIGRWSSGCKQPDGPPRRRRFQLALVSGEDTSCVQKGLRDLFCAFSECARRWGPRLEARHRSTRY